MNSARFETLTRQYRELRVALVGDFCLDRYLEIDPARGEISIETGLAVHNVVRVRSQPGAAGTILNNLVALGIGTLYPVGFAGEDGEGYELARALRALSGVRLDHFLTTPERRTFTYTKPLVLHPPAPPVELNRLDLKNWSPTPPTVSALVSRALTALAAEVDAIIIMDQVDEPETGVITQAVLETVRAIAQARPGLLILADSRRGLQGYPPVCLKMNRAELARFAGLDPAAGLDEIRATAAQLARDRRRPCFITLAEQGILGASPAGEVAQLSALPLRGPIDIVGAGDSITANLTAALAAGATLPEAVELANAAASVVIHQLGTTGTASTLAIAALVNPERAAGGP